MEKDNTASNDRTGGQQPPAHRDDVAGLYTWANLQGAKYRDFSASREKTRTDTRERNQDTLVRNQLDRSNPPAEDAPDATSPQHDDSLAKPSLAWPPSAPPAPRRPARTAERTPALGPRRLQPADSRTSRSPARGAPSRWVALKNVFDKETDRRGDEAFSPVDLDIPSLAFVSLAGGVGKTSLVASLGSALAAEGENLLLVDTHPYNLLPLYFTATPAQPRPFTEAAAGAVQVVTMERELDEPAAPPETSLVETIVRKLHGIDRILIDVSTGSPAILRQALRFSPTVLVTLTPDMASVVSLQAVENLFEQLAEELGRPIELFYLLNRFDPSQRLDMDVRALLTRQLGDRLLPVVIHCDTAVSEALAEGMTVMDYVPNAQVAEDLGSFARWVRELDEPAASVLPAVRWRER